MPHKPPSPLRVASPNDDDRSKSSSSDDNNDDERDDETRARTRLVLRVALRYTPTLARGADGQYGHEGRPWLVAFATHGADNGVGGTVVPSEVVHAAVSDPALELCVDVPFEPGAALHNAAHDAHVWHTDEPLGDAGGADGDGRALLPPSAALGINAYVHTATEQGLEVAARGGETLVALADLATLPLSAAGTHATGTHAAAPLAQLLVQNTGDEPLVKGGVTLLACGVLASDAPPGTPPRPLGDYVRLDASRAAHAVFPLDARLPGAAAHAVAARAVLDAHLAHSLDVFGLGGSADASDPPLLSRSDPPAMRMVHCPYFNTPPGVVPGSRFATLQARARNSPGYFATALGVTLRRANLSAARVLAALRSQDAAPPDRMSDGTLLATRVLVDMLTTQSTSLPYLNDFTNENGDTLKAVSVASSADAGRGGAAAAAPRVRLVRAVRDTAVSPAVAAQHIKISEDYKNAARYGAGDCEDVARTAYANYWQFARARAFEAPDDDTRTLLHELQSRLVHTRMYVPAMVLGSVSNKKLEAGARFTDADNIMAHTYFALLPTRRFLDALPAHVASSAALRASRYALEYEARHARPWHAHAHVHVGEGTARAAAFALPVDAYYRSDAARAAALARHDARAALQMAVARAGMPMDVCATEILPPRRTFDAALRSDRANVSDFYNAVSAMYLSAFGDSGYRDVAFATAAAPAAAAAAAAGSVEQMTHAASFTQFVLPRWDTLRLVAYSRSDPLHDALVGDVLHQLEPPLAVRRAAADVRTPALPAAVRAAVSAQAFDEPLGVRVDAHTLVRAPPASGGGNDFDAAAHDARADAVPLPPPTVVFTVRERELRKRPEAARALTAALRANAAAGRVARAFSYTLTTTRRAERDDLPNDVFHDFEFALAGATVPAAAHAAARLS